MHGVCMACARRVHGACMVHAWRVHGTCVAVCDHLPPERRGALGVAEPVRAPVQPRFRQKVRERHDSPVGEQAAALHPASAPVAADGTALALALAVTAAPAELAAPAEPEPK